MRTALLLLTIGTLSCPAAPPTKGIDLQLLSKVRSIQPGNPFKVGLHIHHHDGYHTYWQNPGIVGIPQALRSWDVTLLSRRNAPVIHLHLRPREHSPQALPGLHFFSSDGQVSSDQAPQISRRPSGSYDLVLRRAEFSPALSTHLPGILACDEPFAPEGRRVVTINPRFPDKKTAPNP